MPTPTAPHLAELRLTYTEAGAVDAYLAAVLRGFHADYVQDLWQHSRRVLEPARCFGFTVDGRWVSTCGAYGRVMSIPGGSVPVAAVTIVTVQPSYRRRGLLRAMMKHQLEDLLEHRREPVALLWASESLIYGRFGYGHCAPRLRISGQTRSTAFLPTVILGKGSVGEVGRDDAFELIPALHNRFLRDRPGSLDRTAAWWEVTLHDPEAWRKGSAAMRFALHFTADGRPDGYVIFRIKEDDDRTGPAGEVEVLDVDAGEPSGYAALWRFVLDLDLVRTYVRRGAPLDEPLRHLVADQRAVAGEFVDGTYARLVDVPRALEARTYAADTDTVIELSDSLLPANDGLFRLETSASGARAGRTHSSPDLTMTVRDLGAVYLGGSSLNAIHQAGLVVEHRTGAVQRLAAALGSPRAPYCRDFF
jgi:predicted acetyltransferase